MLCLGLMTWLDVLDIPFEILLCLSSPWRMPQVERDGQDRGIAPSVWCYFLLSAMALRR